MSALYSSPGRKHEGAGSVPVSAPGAGGQIVKKNSWEGDKPFGDTHTAQGGLF